MQIRQFTDVVTRYERFRINLKTNKRVVQLMESSHHRLWTFAQNYISLALQKRCQTLKDWYIKEKKRLGMMRIGKRI